MFRERLEACAQFGGPPINTVQYWWPKLKFVFWKSSCSKSPFNFSISLLLTARNQYLRKDIQCIQEDTEPFRNRIHDQDHQVYDHHIVLLRNYCHFSVQFQSKICSAISCRTSTITYLFSKSKDYNRQYHEIKKTLLYEVHTLGNS